MTEATKHHLFVAGGIAVAGIALWLVYEKANAASQAAAADAASASPDSVAGISNNDLLAELELGASGVNYSGLEPQGIDIGVQSPNFDADLESALQTLTAAGLLPGSTLGSGGSPVTSPAPGTQTPVITQSQPVGGGGGAGGVVGVICPNGECSPQQRRPVQ